MPEVEGTLQSIERDRRKTTGVMISLTLMTKQVEFTKSQVRSLWFSPDI